MGKTRVLDVTVSRSERLALDVDEQGLLTSLPTIDGCASGVPPARRHVVLAGRLHEGDPRELAAVLDDPRAALAVEGSFAAAVIDPAGCVAVVTDHVGSHPVFAARRHGGLHVTTEPRFGAMPDPLGVASYITNGHVLDDRTPFAGVGMLPPASVTRFEDGRAASIRYWRFDPRRREVGPGDASDEEVLDVLLTAVERRVEGAATVLLALSGGRDSRIVLAALAELGATNVTCFSYERAGATGATDAAVARRLARVAGYEHWTVPADIPSVGHWLELNAARAGGTANVCEELFAWKHLSASSDVVLTGDEGFDPYDTPIGSVRAAVATTHIRPRLALGAARDPLLAAEPAIEHRYTELVERVIAAASPFDTPRDLKERLYLCHRLPRVLMPWRACFATLAGRVETPLLDRRLLELAPYLRRERSPKASLRRVARTAFPRFFEPAPAARAGYLPPWPRLLARDRENLRLQLQRSSGLDRLIDPERILALLPGASSPVCRVRRLACQAPGALAMRTPMLPGLLWRLDLAAKRVVDDIALLQRLLVLRLCFHGESSSNGGSR